MAGFADRSVNFNDGAFVGWLSAQRRKPRETFVFGPKQSILDMGLTVLGERSTVTAGFKTRTTLGVRRYYALRKGRVYRQTMTLDLPVHYDFEASMGIRLYASAALSAEVRAEMLRAFQSFSPGGDIDSVCVEVASRLGLTFGDFELEFYPTCILQAVTIDDRQEKWLFAQFEEVPPPVHVPMPGEGSLRHRGYRLDMVDEVYLGSAPTVPVIPGTIEKVPGMSENDILEIIHDRVTKDASKSDCPPDIIEVFKLASMHGAPQSKTEWEWKITEVGGCKFHIWQTTTYWRNVEHVLYATISFPFREERIKELIRKCAEQAAIEGGILLLATQNFAVALATFTARFKTLLAERMHEEIVCVLPDIRVVDEAGEWR